MQPKSIFFDFDGVLLDTLEAKGRAIAKPFQQYGNEIYTKVYDYHLNHGGMNRKIKVQNCYKLFLNQEISDAELEKFLTKIGAEMQSELLKCEPVNGALDFMQKHQSMSGRAWIVSAAPQDEIRSLALHFGYARFVEESFGFPNAKGAKIRELILSEKLNPSDCLMIGDAEEDLKAATQNQISFLLRKTPYSAFARQYTGTSILDFREALTAIAML